MNARILITAVAVVLFPSVASADGWLFMRSHFSRVDDGSAAAEMHIYNSEGELIHSGRGSGGWSAGEEVAVPAGDYWVEIGRFRSEYNLRRFTVADGQTTVVPTGWVSVTTLVPEDQPPGCDQWNAELTAFVVDADGEEHMISNNRGTGVVDYGRLQLPTGTYRVYFHGFPADVEILEDQILDLPTGYQDPVLGERAQIALNAEGAARNVILPLCENGGFHMPAGDYHISRIVPTDVYPFEERVWDRVSVQEEDSRGYDDLGQAQVRSRYRGAGSEPVAITPADSGVLRNYRSGAQVGVVSSGFDDLLP
ncbi:MAG: hypothetical protein KC561_13210, partial [Myxococcales bacterium]|nr:hypothetical protein [Myxococcales bacterium]